MGSAIWNGWEAQLLTAIGAPVTADNVNFLDAWAASENTNAEYNPLATTQTEPGSTFFNYIGNGIGVQSYNSAQQGVSAMAQTLRYYPTIMQALQSGSPFSYNGSQLQSELSTWGSHLFVSSLQNGSWQNLLGGVLSSGVAGVISGNPALGISGAANAAANNPQQAQQVNNATTGWATQLTSWANTQVESLVFIGLAMALISGGILWMVQPDISSAANFVKNNPEVLA